MAGRQGTEVVQCVSHVLISVLLYFIFTKSYNILCLSFE